MFKSTITILGFAIIAALLTGCTAPANTSTAPTTKPAASAAPTEKSAAPLDPIAQAQVDSGLDAAAYAAVTAKADALGVIVEGNAFRKATKALSDESGKPVAIVAHDRCQDGTPMWGVSGELYAPAPASQVCGQGAQSSMEAALAEAHTRAEADDLGAGDYILVVVDFLS